MGWLGIGWMSVALNQYKPLYRLIPKSLSSRFDSGEFGEKELFLISDLTYPVVNNESYRARHLPQDRSRDFLKGMLSNSYREVVDRLLAEDILQVRSNEQGRESYSTQYHHSKQYSLTKKYRDEVVKDGVDGRMIKDHRQLKRINHFLENTTKNLLEKNPWLKTEIDSLKRISFQKKEAESWVREVYERQEFRGEPLTNATYHRLLRSINELDQLFTSDSLPHISIRNGRVFHALVNAHKEFRQFLRSLSNEPLVEVDMKSAQWVMLCKALALKEKHNYTSNLIENIEKHFDSPIDILATLPEKSVPVVKEDGIGLTGEWTPADAHHFARTVFFDDIYTELGLLKSSTGYAIPSGWRHPNRTAFKEESIAESLYNYFTNPEQDVIHGDWEVRHIRSVLMDTYPTVYSFLLQCAQESTSNKRSRDLAILMQKYEGYFFHRVLQPALKEVLDGSGYAIIHDAFYLPESKREEAVEVMNEEAFKFFGCPGFFNGRTTA